MEEQDFELPIIFGLAESIPAPILNLYLIIAFRSVQFFDKIERIDDATLQHMIHYGLVAKQPIPTAQQALEIMSIAKLRELVVLAGTGFKAKDSASIRKHLKTHMNTKLEQETIKRARYAKYQFLPPPGWTWGQFQFFRSDYPCMLDALHQWMFNGWAPPAAAKRFTALI